MREGGAAGAAATAPRSKLPPNPSTTLCRPAKQRALQRAAERAVAEQDAQALRQLLGGTEEGAAGEQAPCEGGSAAAGDQPGPSGRAELDGCLSRAALEALLPGAQPSQLAQHQSSAWSAGAAQQQQSLLDTGQPGASQPSMPLLGAEPSALTTYITRLEEEDGLVQRQLTHLQASTSGGRAGLPPPLRSARNPLAPGRREVFVLSKWLEVRGRAVRHAPAAAGRCMAQG